MSKSNATTSTQSARDDIDIEEGIVHKSPFPNEEESGGDTSTSTAHQHQDANSQLFLDGDGADAKDDDDIAVVGSQQMLFADWNAADADSAFAAADASASSPLFLSGQDDAGLSPATPSSASAGLQIQQDNDVDVIIESSGNAAAAGVSAADATPSPILLPCPKFVYDNVGPAITIPGAVAASFGEPGSKKMASKARGHVVEQIVDGDGPAASLPGAVEAAFEDSTSETTKMAKKARGNVEEMHDSGPDPPTATEEKFGFGDDANIKQKMSAGRSTTAQGLPRCDDTILIPDEMDDKPVSTIRTLASIRNRDEEEGQGLVSVLFD